MRHSHDVNGRCRSCARYAAWHTCSTLTVMQSPGVCVKSTDGERGDEISFTLHRNFMLLMQEQLSCFALEWIQNQALCCSTHRRVSLWLDLGVGKLCFTFLFFPSIQCHLVRVLNARFPEAVWQKPLGFGFVGTGKNTSVAFVLEVCKNEDNLLPYMGM